MSSRTEPLLTVADLDSFPDDGNRYELIAGVLYVSRAPGIPHQLVLQNLLLELNSYLTSNPCGRIVFGAGAVFSDHDAVIPDLVFVSNEKWATVVENERFVGAPEIVIEVMSKGRQNRSRDLTAKRGLYETYQAAEYWIVDCENESVYLFRHTGTTLDQVATLNEGRHDYLTVASGISDDAQQTLSNRLEISARYLIAWSDLLRVVG